MVDSSSMTQEQRRMWDKLVAMLLYGLEKGLWNMLGEASFAITNTVGQEMLQILEAEGLQTTNRPPEELAHEVGQYFTKQMGIAETFDIEKEDSSVALHVHQCILIDVEKDLLEQGIQPFLCPFLNITMSALRKNTGGATAITEFQVNPQTQRCLLRFQILD